MNKHSVKQGQKILSKAIYFVKQGLKLFSLVTGMWEQSLLIITKQTLQGTAGICYRSHSKCQNTGHHATDK